jgi:Lipoprotein LpqB beta-propeller domain/Sporulation and spore germination
VTGDERQPSSRVVRARVLQVLVLVLSCAVLTGCGSIPDSGPVKISTARRVDEQQDSRVRVVAVPPQKGQSQTEVVQGFLDATTSDEADFETARLYLTRSAARSWDPKAGVVVFEGGYRKQVPQADRLVVSSTLLATVDPQGVYRPAGSDARAWSATLSLEQQDGQWRIATPPAGLLLSKEDFKRLYRPVSLYFFSSPDPADAGRRVLVPDPIYVRDRATLPSVLARAVLHGPTPWLAPVLLPTFPARTTLTGDVSLAGGMARVPVSDAVLGTAQELRDLMAVQMLATLVQASGVNSVQLVAGSNGKSVVAAQATRDMLTRYDPQAVPVAGGYWIRDRRLVRLRPDDANGHDPQAVSGPFGDGSVALDSAAVSVDGHWAAGVDADLSKLYRASLTEAPGTGVQQIRVSQRPLSSPSWDGRGRLWVLEGAAPDQTDVLMVRGTNVLRVGVEGLTGKRVLALKAARDGNRVAMVLDDGDQDNGDQSSSVVVGRVEFRQQADGPAVFITGLRAVSPKLVEVRDVSWNGGIRLAVLGREAQGAMQLRIVDIDGSNMISLGAPAVDLKRVAAPSPASPEVPMLVGDGLGVIWLLGADNLQNNLGPGSSPVYAG